jgi:NAD(P)-dependent dehydrogenase (short-subunit alcohol dehydrogenase family)
MPLNGKVSIVTGAGSGLGEASAKQLADRGAMVVVSDVNQDAAERVAGEIRAAGEKAVAFGCDISVLADVERMVAFAVETYGGLHIALNNAGIIPLPVELDKIDPKLWARVIDINLTGTFYCMKTQISHFLKNGGGAIVNMASTAGVMAHPTRAAYAASKHGVIGLTRTAAIEYATRGIRVNAVAPGPIMTAAAAGLPKEILDASAAKTALRRFGQPVEVANTVTFLLSDEASFITGAVYEINGGQTQL